MTTKLKNTSTAAIASRRNMHIFLCWLLFSILYGVAAYYKPWHSDEFYSWVYSGRCSFFEILRLKEFGIGHPPLFHLLQKGVQEIFQPQHFIFVRLINFFIGSLFVITFISIFSTYKYTPFFWYSVCASAAILNTFVFSRMWGLVCLSSLITLWAGERFVERANFKNFLLMAGIALLGLLSDYNYILLAPYLFMVLFKPTSLYKPIVRTMVVVLLSLLIFSHLYHAIKIAGNFVSGIYHLAKSIIELSFEVGLSVLYVRFYELFIMGFIIIAGVYWFHNRQERNSDVKNHPISFFNFIGLLYSLLITSYLVTNHHPRRILCVIPVIIYVGYLSIQYIKKIHTIDLSSFNSRLMLSFICGLCLLLIVNPYFWTSLICARFVISLLPLLLLFIMNNVSRSALRALSLVLIFSGILYIASISVSQYYPAPYVKTKLPVVYFDDFAYCSTYMNALNKSSKEPYIIDYSKFEKFCKICRMGTDQIPFDEFERFIFIAKHTIVPENFIPRYFYLIEKEEYLSPLDRLLFKFLTPINTTRFHVYRFQRTTPSIEESRL